MNNYDLLRKKWKQHKKNLKVTNEINKKINRLETVIKESEGLTAKNDGFETVKMKPKDDKHFNPDKASGVWIVKNRNDKDVEMVRFSSVVRDSDNFPFLSIHLPNSGPMIGKEDGKEVTFNPGDLIRCHYEGDMDRGSTFRFANVGTNDPTTELQYQYALGKLGLGAKIELPEGFQIVDGNFRRMVN